MEELEAGLIVEKKNTRDYPLNKIAERTIGNERNFDGTKFSGVGLEHAFGSELRGKKRNTVDAKKFQMENGSPSTQITKLNQPQDWI